MYRNVIPCFFSLPSLQHLIAGCLMTVGPVFSLSIDILKYIIYGLAAGFFVFGVLLLVEGFFTTGAIRDLYGEFKITACGRCLTAFVSNKPPKKYS